MSPHQSRTPRSDAQAIDSRTGLNSPTGNCVRIEFAWTLELENASLKAELLRRQNTPKTNRTKVGSVVRECRSEGYPFKAWLSSELLVVRRVNKNGTVRVWDWCVERTLHSWIVVKP